MKAERVGALIALPIGTLIVSLIALGAWYHSAPALAAGLLAYAAMVGLSLLNVWRDGDPERLPDTAHLHAIGEHVSAHPHFREDCFACPNEARHEIDNGLAACCSHAGLGCPEAHP